MAGRGCAPKDPTQRRNRAKPARGEWTPAGGTGWQHGRIPAPPSGLGDAAREAWAAWFGSWVAAHWGPWDLPVLRLVIRLFDQVERGAASGALRAELRMLLDNYGLTPKGRQDRRWAPPKPAPAVTTPPDDPVDMSRYAHLRAERSRPPT